MWLLPGGTRGEGLAEERVQKLYSILAKSTVTARKTQPDQIVFADLTKRGRMPEIAIACDVQPLQVV
eukprot:5683846-Pyramimonas_sp.AAC.1